MSSTRSILPRFVPPLDPDFRPASLAVRAFDAAVAEAGGGVPLVLGLERAEGDLSRFETRVFPEGHPRFAANFPHVERLVKFLLWARGGWQLFVGGPHAIGKRLARVYAPRGARQFDYHFLGEQVYQQRFTVVPCYRDEVPARAGWGRRWAATWTAAASALTWAHPI